MATIWPIEGKVPMLDNESCITGALLGSIVAQLALGPWQKQTSSGRQQQLSEPSPYALFRPALGRQYQSHRRRVCAQLYIVYSRRYRPGEQDRIPSVRIFEVVRVIEANEVKRRPG